MAGAVALAERTAAAGGETLPWAHDPGTLSSQSHRGSESPPGSTAAPVAGDANIDGPFDHRDLIQVLVASRDRTGQPATWQEGDWNADYVFDELDIIAALGRGAHTCEAGRPNLPRRRAHLEQRVFNQSMPIHRAKNIDADHEEYSCAVDYLFARDQIVPGC